MAAARRAILQVAFECWQSRVTLGYEYAFACPSCGAQSQLQLQLALTTVQCGDCLEVFDVRLPSLYSECMEAVDEAAAFRTILIAPAFCKWVAFADRLFALERAFNHVVPLRPRDLPLAVGSAFDLWRRACIVLVAPVASYTVGSSVIVCGLQSRPELNAVVAEVVQWHTAKCRYVVRADGVGVPLLLKPANLRPAPALLWPSAVRHVDADSRAWSLDPEQAALRRMMAAGDFAGVRRFWCEAWLRLEAGIRDGLLYSEDKGVAAMSAVFGLWASLTSAYRRAVASVQLASGHHSVSRPFGVWASFAAAARRRGLRRAVPIVDIYSTGPCRPSAGILLFLASTTSAPAPAIASPTPPAPPFAAARPSTPSPTPPMLPLLSVQLPEQSLVTPPCPRAVLVGDWQTARRRGSRPVPALVAMQVSTTVPSCFPRLRPRQLAPTPPSYQWLHGHLLFAPSPSLGVSELPAEPVLVPARSSHHVPFAPAEAEPWVWRAEKCPDNSPVSPGSGARLSWSGDPAATAVPMGSLRDTVTWVAAADRLGLAARSRRRDRPVSRASTSSMSDAVVQHAAREAVPPKRVQLSTPAVRRAGVSPL